MKEFNQLPNLRLYRFMIMIVIAVMILGIFTSPFESFGMRISVQSIFVVLISILLWMYPNKETNSLKGSLIFLIAAYFYAIFLMYQETSLNFIFIALLPTVAIGFYHKKLFYSIFILNFVGAMWLFFHVYSSTNPGFAYLKNDFTGNILDFIGSQAIVYFVFFMTTNRIEKIQQYNEQIQSTERLKTTGQLAAAVAHEIRNPIAVVKGFLQFYREDESIPAHAKEHFKLMLGEMDQAEIVIQDFLSLAKPNDEQSATVNAREAVNSVVDLLSSYASMNNIRLSIDVPEPTMVNCSKVELKQVLVNIIKNGIESMKFGGDVQISSQSTGNYFTLKVSDNGVGLDEHELKELGKPFYTLKSSGTGLGLMICYNIMNKYGGSLNFKSKKGEGTTVYLTFKKAD
ncbi:sensor histidine kinase [Falsibacillus albus]|uniref:histidine kinase n=1 Tax=Falsibacillus albus TaxID=2478915 RepID=A0A3L7JTG3_9BACI|nr:HAMP domain-containing sensor histidine kinase [Falsibacillus albus]RLQ93790.1 sensor histidine kinase [Falsibacillus albus]